MPAEHATEYGPRFSALMSELAGAYGNGQRIVQTCKYRKYKATFHVPPRRRLHAPRPCSPAPPGTLPQPRQRLASAGCSRQAAGQHRPDGAWGRRGCEAVAAARRAAGLKYAINERLCDDYS